MRYRFLERRIDARWEAPAVLIEEADGTLVMQEWDKLVSIPADSLDDLTVDDIPRWEIGPYADELRLSEARETGRPSDADFVWHFLSLIGERSRELAGRALRT